MPRIDRPARSIAIALLAAALAVALVACGDDSGSSSDGTAATEATTSSSADTVSTESISGVGQVLVDADGNALYTNDQDSASAIACTGECAQIWIPLTVDPGTDPGSSDSALASKLGVTTNPDGATQVTFEGRPLYTFTQDSPGSATGDGVTDSFGGTTFSWTVASASGSSGDSGGSTSTDSSSSSGTSGGYSYGGGY